MQLKCKSRRLWWGGVAGTAQSASPRTVLASHRWEGSWESSSPGNPPPFRLCRRSLLSSCWSLGQCLPSPASSDVVLYLPVPLLPNFSVMEVFYADLHGSVLEPCRAGAAELFLTWCLSMSYPPFLIWPWIVTSCVCFPVIILKYTIKLTSKCFYSR